MFCTFTVLQAEDLSVMKGSFVSYESPGITYPQGHTAAKCLFRKALSSIKSLRL